MKEFLKKNEAKGDREISCKDLKERYENLRFARRNKMAKSMEQEFLIKNGLLEWSNVWGNYIGRNLKVNKKELADNQKSLSISGNLEIANILAMMILKTM